MKYKETYRTSTSRLASWDYSNTGAYFVTICTRDKKQYFGSINVHENNELANVSVVTTQLGQRAIEEWHKTPEIRPDMNIELLDFVLMPNHIHGIIFIKENEYNTRRDAMPRVLNDTSIQSRRDAMPRVLTGETERCNRFSSQSKNLASIIRGYKSAVTMYARLHNIEFAWQPKYYEHVIRNEQDLQRIQVYIQNNPAQWKLDELYNNE